MMRIQVGLQRRNHRIQGTRMHRSLVQEYVIFPGLEVCFTVEGRYFVRPSLATFQLPSFLASETLKVTSSVLFHLA